MITVYKVRIHDMLAYQRIRTFDVLIFYGFFRRILLFNRSIICNCTVVFDKFCYLTVVFLIPVRLFSTYFVI